MESSEAINGLRVAVTGGTSGLGLALVRRLADLGARVAFVARSADSVARVAAETGAIGVVGDVGDKDAIYPI
ncbi:MAG: SDR family NAD(P)-dependent oxidoreductase, partial [Acidimicrobiia bacterium]|nr:SDR family NAD(P)-dependent oxidoreductase [Acidimicrobiia bacterium]